MCSGNLTSQSIQFAYSRMIPELYFLYAKYFPGEWNNATQSSKFSEKDNEFEYIFVIICKYIYEPC